MAKATVQPSRDARQVAVLLDLPEIAQLIADLEATRWTGRPGYPIRAMVGAALVKGVYALPTWTRTARLIGEHAALREVLGAAPSVYACYRFGAKMREHGDALDRCLDGVLAKLREQLPEMGEHLAIDGSDLPAYANGHRHVGNKNGPLRDHYSDPDASWGHRSAISTRKGGGYYGYKVHAAVCTRTGLPVAWRVDTASTSEHEHVAPLLDSVLGRGFTPGTCAMDKDYDGAAHVRGVRGPRRPSGDPAAADGQRLSWQGQGPNLPARHLDVRRVGREAGSVEVALPDGRVLASLDVDQGRPAAPVDPAWQRPVALPVRGAQCGRAGVRRPQTRVGDAAAPRPSPRPGAAACRPDDPAPAGPRARQDGDRRRRIAPHQGAQGPTG